MLSLFNTETRQKQLLQKIDNRPIRMYTCGPTVYDFAHIGNFRTYVFEDLLRRTLKYFGFQVIQAMNLTDVDDKTIKGAIQKGISLDEFTEPYVKAFFEDIRTMRIESVEHYPRATHYIPEMINIIETLLKKEYAYRGKDGSIYFSIRRFSQYGKLSHLQLNELIEGASDPEIAQDEYEKENASDFVLWKIYDKARDGEIYWESPFGKGRPGWHIECSAMAMKILGETIDLHCGGVDNIFPHHENEIAQSECCSGKPFVRHWVHVEHLLVDHRKMSKSMGNFYTLRDLLQKGFSASEIRYMLLQTHYRIQLNFTFHQLQAVRSALARIESFIQRLREIHVSKKPAIDSFLKKTKEHFQQALADDINISLALSCIFELLREMNALIDQNLIGKEDAKEILKLLEEFDQVLAVLPLEPSEIKIPQEIQIAMQKREKAREEKNWKLADELREYIYSEGYFIEDTPSGLRVKKTL